MKKLEWMFWSCLWVGCLVSAQSLDWQGGGGNWDLVTAAWSSEGGALQSWPGSGGATARFGGTPGTVSVQGDVKADGLVFQEPGYVIAVDVSPANRLTLSGEMTGAATVQFSGAALSGTDRYGEALMARGLRFTGGGPVAFSADLTVTNLNASHILTVSGADTVVTYAGLWQGDGGNAFPHLYLRDGGRFVLGEASELNFVNDAYFTRQLWVSGDGTGADAGAIEFAEAFVADLSEGGTVTNGLGSIRLNNATVITRHTQGIPVHFRPRPGHPDGPQTNGHFVFEHNPGKWIVATNPQSYAGGVWIRADVEIHTETDLTHVGVTEDDNQSAFPYRAGNAFQTNVDDLVITKTGPGALILAGEQAFRPGTEMRVTEGRVQFATDPAAGFFHNSLNQDPSEADPDLQVVVAENGRAVFTASASRLHSLQTEGTLEIVLGEGPDPVVAAEGSVTLGGTLHLRLAEGHAPAPGSVFTLLSANEITGDFEQVTFGPGGLFEVEVFQDRVEATALAPQGAIQEILYDAFANLDNWQDLSRAVTWTSSPSAETVFQITADGAADHVLNLNDASRDVAMWGSNGIRSYSAVDHRFAQPISHRDSEVTIEFRMRWDKLTSNEGNRVVFTLIHDYPTDGLDLTPDARIEDFSQAWWGRPAYQVRLRSQVASDGVPIFLYGGGHDLDGEFEAGDDGWSAGFSSAPGGGTPGVGSPYPNSGWALGNFSPVSTSYRRYRYIVKPNVQELWVNEADDGQTWTFVGDMPLPFEEDAPSSAPLYRYFESFEGLRIYFRSPGTGSNASNVYLDYVRISVESLDSPPGYAAWAATNLAGIPADGPQEDPFGHGITNLLRYALGYPVDALPESEQRPRLLPSAAAGQMVYRFERPQGGREDVNYQISITGDLMANDWQPVDPSYWVVIPGASGRETVEIAISSGTGPLFAALEVILADTAAN